VAESDVVLEEAGALTVVGDGDGPVAAAGSLADPADPAGRQRRRTNRLVAGLAGLAVGVVAVIAGTMVVQDATAVVRVGLVLAGLGAVYLGADQLGRFVFGVTFEIALWFSVLWLAIVGLAAVTADWLPLAESKDVSKTLLAPTLQRPDIFSEHPLGTDRQGLDILGGVVYGARVSLIVSLGAVLIGLVVGGVIGLVAGYFRGRAEAVVGVLTDSMLAFPPLILLLGMVAVLEPSVRNVTIALGLLGIPTYIRLSRANTMVFAQREFVLSARALGARNRRVIFRELLPNVALPLVSYGFIVVGALIVAEASLSFLGLSIRRPNPTWGNMIAASQNDFDRHPHLVFVPGIVLFLTVFALNRVGDKARKLWDPRQSRL
jgi:peptide/nickel transport system permease protein